MLDRVNIHILRVFVNEQGEFGNPVGIVLDEKKGINPKVRQDISTKLGFSESVFINDPNTGNVSIFNPKEEVDFAGHALVGSAYLINEILKRSISFLECKGGRIATWQEGGLTWIRAGLANTPHWHHEQLPDVYSVENLPDSITKSKEHTIVWAWLNKDKDLVRARTFAPDWGIPEDEANGSGAMQLAAIAGRKLEIYHGRGSVIYANPADPGFACVGGRVEEAETQEVVA